MCRSMTPWRRIFRVTYFGLWGCMFALLALFALRVWIDAQ